MPINSKTVLEDGQRVSAFEIPGVFLTNAQAHEVFRISKMQFGGPPDSPLLAVVKALAEALDKDGWCVPASIDEVTA